MTQNELHIATLPLGGAERLLVTADLRGMTLARSLAGRPVRAHRGFFLKSSKARVWKTLYEAGVITMQGSYGWKYKRPDDGNFESLELIIGRLRKSGAIKP